MKNLFIFLTSVLICVNASANILSSKVGTINKLYAYDDHGAVEGREGAAVYIYMDTGLTACPHSIYISPNAPGYKTLVSFALTAYTTKSTVRFQVYDDRKLAGRCEVDAIRFE